MCEIKVKIIKLIGLFECLYNLEKKNNYNKILILYNKCLINIIDKENNEIIEEDFSSLINVTRLFFEVRPKNNELAEYILNRIQDCYELERKIIEQNLKK